ncbi:MAG: type II toxin-antitoxin system HicA family toxin [Bryobacteraceae bacterium]|jgi:hypothetical protein
MARCLPDRRIAYLVANGGVLPEEPTRLPSVIGNKASLANAWVSYAMTQSVAMPAAWDNGISARLMPKRYTSRELVKLAEEFGWRLAGVRGNHHNFKHPASGL